MVFTCMTKRIDELSLFQLSLLISLCETNSLTVTAAQKHITVSSAFRALKGLREALGDPLFTRSGDGLLPTAFCTQLKNELPRVLSELKTMLEPETEDYKQSKRVIRIVCPGQVYSTIIDEAVLAISMEAPNLSFEIFPRSNDLINRMRNGLIDFAFYPLFELANDFHSYELYNAGFVYLVRKDHPLALSFQQNGEIKSEEIAQFKKIQFSNSDNDEGHRIAISNLSNHQQPIISTSFLVASLPLLEKSDFTMTVPTRFALKMAPYFNLTPIPFETGWPNFKRRLIWHDQTHQSLLFQWIRSMIITYSQTTDAEKKLLGEFQKNNDRF